MVGYIKIEKTKKLKKILKMKNKDIAAMEHISPAQVSQSIRGGIKRLRQYLSRDEWADRL